MGLLRKLLNRLGFKRFLCDSCAYDYPGACSRPERPNALDCPDYRPRF